jgi:hypothetical protein
MTRSGATARRSVAALTKASCRSCAVGVLNWPGSPRPVGQWRGCPRAGPPATSRCSRRGVRRDDAERGAAEGRVHLGAAGSAAGEGFPLKTADLEKRKKDFRKQTPPVAAQPMWTASGDSCGSGGARNSRLDQVRLSAPSERLVRVASAPNRPSAEQASQSLPLRMAKSSDRRFP